MPVPLRRIALTVLTARARPPSGQLRHRVWPSYVDFNFHMNHAAYLEVMELARWHWCAEREVLGAWLRGGLRPIVVHEEVRYKRELKPMQPFDVHTRLVRREGKVATFQQRFLANGALHAEGHCSFLMVRKRSVLDEGTVAELLDRHLELASG